MDPRLATDAPGDDVDAGTIEQLSETIDRELRGEVRSVDRVFFDATPRRAHARMDAA